MAKKNKYWGLVAVGAATAAAAGAIAAFVMKKKPDKDIMDFEDDFEDDFDEDFETPENVNADETPETAEDFASWEENAEEASQTPEAPASEEAENPDEEISEEANAPAEEASEETEE